MITRRNNELKNKFKKKTVEIIILVSVLVGRRMSGSVQDPETLSLFDGVQVGNNRNVIRT